MGIPDHLIYFLRNLYVSQEAVVKTEHETMTGSKLGKECDKAVYHCPVYLTPMQSTLREVILQFSSVAQSCLTLCDPMDCSTPGFPVHHQLLELKLMSIESVMPFNHLTLCRPLLLPPSIFPSIRVFSDESVLCMKWPKYWSFSFSLSPSNEYSGLIFFRIDWLDLLAVQGILKSLLQHIKPTVFAIFLR